MRKVIYSTKKKDEVKYPGYFANMCNIVGSEETFPVDFEDYMVDNYSIDVEDLDDEEFDHYFTEYRESLEKDDTNEVEVSETDEVNYSLDIDLDADINMNSDGSWDFEDTSWSVCADSDDGGWYTSDDILISSSDQLVQDVNSLLQLYLPIDKGTFNITGNIHLVYDKSDDGEMLFDIAHSEVKNFYSAPVKE